MSPTPAHLPPKLLPGQAQVSKWLKAINSFGPRLTGSVPHKNSIDFLERELHRIGGFLIHRDVRYFTRWEAKKCGLSTVGRAKSFNVSSCFPYSGQTPPQGISGKLIYYPRLPLSFRRAAGKIALVDVRLSSLPRIVLRLLLRVRDRFPTNSIGLPSRFSSPLSLLYKNLHLKAAAQAGARGVIYIWRNCSDPNTTDQYLPFDKPYQNCPALWVNGTEGDKLVRASKRGNSVHLVLDAVIDHDAQTDSLWAVLPGIRANETIIVNTHTDGPNACEENGVVGLLALASYFSKLARQGKLQRTLVFVFVTGHFRLPQLAEYPPHQATHHWLKAHPDLWDGKSGHKRAVAAATLEHLGCMEWKDTDDHSNHRPTGDTELELVYASNSKLNEIYLRALQGRTLGRTLTLKPLPIYLGEGQPLYEVGIPTISLITLPDYLCAAPSHGDIHKLDQSFMYEQIETFARVITELDGLKTEEIGKPDRPFILDRLLFGLAKRIMRR